MKLSDILNAAIWPLKALDKETSNIVAEKTDVAMTTVFAELGEHAPILAALLAGKEIKVEVTLKLVV